MSKEMGKPITQTLFDLNYDIDYIQWHIDHTESILNPEIAHQDENSIHTMYFEPKWVAASISPRNYPSTLLIREVIPPLLAWNTILYKASEKCIWTAKIISDLLVEHLPDNVFIPVYGHTNLGQALVELATEMTIFTGSTKVGQSILQTNSTLHKISHLELGGSAPGIILPETTIDDAMLEMIEYTRVWHSGQVCDGLKRLFVHESQYDELTTKLSDYFKSMIIWNPLDPNARLWCLISEQAKETILTQINDSLKFWFEKKELGVYDGTPWPFMPFTILCYQLPVTSYQSYGENREQGTGNGEQGSIFSAPCMNQEVFGPVLPIISYTSIDQAIEFANNTIYGLGWYVWWSDGKQIDYVCARLKTGNINVNNTNFVIPQVPFGGYKPLSGNYREHGIIWLRSYTEMKVVSRPRN